MGGIRLGLSQGRTAPGRTKATLLK
jgi:hypothetical protein